MKKTLSMLLAALLLAGTTTTALAADNAPTAKANEEVNLIDAGAELIKGDKEFVSGTLDNVFDGTMATFADYGVDGGEEYWVGIKMPYPVVLTWFQAWAPDYENDGVPNRPHVVHGTILEGSNDGENWEFILRLGDNYNGEYLEYAYDLEDGLTDYFDEIPFDGETSWDDDATDPVAYTYFRIYNNTDGVAIWGDLQLWGIPEYTPGDINMDEEVDINDAMLLFQNSMLPDIFTIDYPGSVDFTKDGITDINDSLYLFQHTLLPNMYPLA